MKQRKNRSFLFLTGLFLMLFQVGYSQTETTETEQKTAQVSYKLNNDNAIYSFTPLTEYDEFKTAQRVDRINGLTGDNATVEFKKNKIRIELNPTLTTGENLDRLILLIAKIHGYSSYQLIN